MRATPIRVYSEGSGFDQLKSSFRKNWIHYFQEAAGLALFMMSACLFGALLEGKDALLYNWIPDKQLRLVSMGLFMGLTALFIFYSPFTSPSGSQINPSVTLSFVRLGKMGRYDALFYIISQFVGGIVAVIFMQQIMGAQLIDPPVNSVATIPGPAGPAAAAVVEFSISFFTMYAVLFANEHSILKRFSRIIPACLVCMWVITSGPISGFGMNPARSFASAFPSGHWEHFWIYVVLPTAGMLLATELFIQVEKNKKNHSLTLSEK